MIQDGKPATNHFDTLPSLRAVFSVLAQLSCFHCKWKIFPISKQQPCWLYRYLNGPRGPAKVGEKLPEATSFTTALLRRIIWIKYKLMAEWHLPVSFKCNQTRESIDFTRGRAICQLAARHSQCQLASNRVWYHVDDKT